VLLRLEFMHFLWFKVGEIMQNCQSGNHSMITAENFKIDGRTRTQNVAYLLIWLSFDGNNIFDSSLTVNYGTFAVSTHGRHLGEAGV